MLQINTRFSELWEEVSSEQGKLSLVYSMSHGVLRDHLFLALKVLVDNDLTAIKFKCFCKKQLISN